jgi:phage-related protein
MSTRRGSQRGGAQQADPASQPPRPPPGRKWIWFRNERGGRPKAREEFESLPTAGQAGLAAKIQRYLADQSRPGDVDSLGHGILELRHRSENVQYRVLFMRWGRHCVALTAFCKKQRTTPKVDLDRAKARAQRWREVFGAEPND